MEKICWQITVAAFMQPLQYDLRDPAAKDNSITNAATARSNLDAAITMRSAEDWVAKHNRTTRNGVGNCSSKTGWISMPERKKDDFEALFKRTFRRKISSAKMEKICWQITVAAFMQPLQYDLRSPAAKDSSITHAAKAGSNLDAATTMRSAKTELQTAIPFTLRERSYRCKAEWNSIGNSSTSNTCNPIYIAGTILQLQITMECHRQLIHQHHLQSHLHCGNDPTVAKSHRNSIGNSSTSTTCNPIYIAGTILQLQITMEFCRPHMHEKQSPFTMRNRSDHDPTMIRPHTRPSRNRRTAEVNHRGSGTDFVWKNIGFRASAISQKRISCETSFKTPSATHPPAPLAIPFALRERSYSCNSQWNSVDRTCTKNRWNAIYNAEPIRPWSEHDPNMIRPWSEHDPTTHETVSQPSHRRGRSSRFGDGLCMEKHKVSCICYLSKTHFVRDFLQNSIGNSSTSTLQPHLQCGTDPTMIRTWSEHDPTMIRPHTRPSRNRRTAEVDHRGLGTDFVWKNKGFRASAISQKRISCETSFKTPSATHPPAPLATPFTMRNRSDHDPNMIRPCDPTMIRPWSDHTRDRLATVAPQR